MKKYFAFIFLLFPQLLLAQTGGAGRLRPSLIPQFPRDIKDEKLNEGKREEHVKIVKRHAGQEKMLTF